MSAQHVIAPLVRHSGILKDEELFLRLLQPTSYSISAPRQRAPQCACIMIQTCLHGLAYPPVGLGSSIITEHNIVIYNSNSTTCLLLRLHLMI